MLQVLQQPDTINYSLNLRDIHITGDNAVWTTLSVGNHFIEETYDIPQYPGGYVRIELSDLIHEVLRGDLPDDLNIVSESSHIVRNVTFSYREPLGPFTTINFKVIKGMGLRILPGQSLDLETFLKYNWLSMMPSGSVVYYHQPLYMSAFPHQNCEVWLSAKMLSGPTTSVKLTDLQADKMQYINCNPGMLVGLLGGEYEYVEISTRTGGGDPLIPARRYYYGGFYPFDADVFVYLNHLGGWDTLVMQGRSDEVHKVTPTVARIDDWLHNYHTDHEFMFEKNSGFIRTELERRQHIDFLRSSEIYYLFEGHMIPVIVQDTTAQTTRGVLQGYSFTFRPKDTKRLYRELNQTPYLLNI